MPKEACERAKEPCDTAERAPLLRHAFLRLVTPAAAEEEVDVVPENWQTPAVFGIGREKAHATLFPFESRELALLGNREHSERFLSLDGIWKFYWSVQYVRAHTHTHTHTHTASGSSTGRNEQRRGDV